jgi:folylpolyglutamate synthase/dihydropteroate synthase
MRTTVASVSPLLAGEGEGEVWSSTRRQTPSRTSPCDGEGNLSNLHLIVGFSDNKDIKQMIRQLASLRPASIACTRQTQNPFRKAANPRLIADQFKLALVPLSHHEVSDSRRETKIEMFLDPKDALAWNKKQTKTSDVILITGSIFLSGEIKNFV